VTVPIRFRLTRRFPAAMTEAGYRGLRRFASEAGLTEAEALSFLFENLAAVTNAEALQQRLPIFRATLSAQKD
jgi:hypothetical protein